MGVTVFQGDTGEQVIRQKPERQGKQCSTTHILYSLESAFYESCCYVYYESNVGLFIFSLINEPR